MSTIDWPGAAVLLAFGLMGAEYVGWLALIPWVFRFGIPVFSQRRELAQPAVASGTVLQTEEGNFRVVGPELVLVTKRFRYRPYTVFPIKGSITWRDGVATIRARVVLFPSIFFAAALVSITVGAARGLAGDYGNQAIWFVLLWFVLAAAFMGLVARAGWNSFERVLDELKNSPRPPWS